MDKMVSLLTMLLFIYNSILAIIVAKQTWPHAIFYPLMTFILLDYFILFYFADKVVSQMALRKLIGAQSTGGRRKRRKQG